MDSAKLNDWLQVIGIFALVASLIFVGLQMKQNQQIGEGEAAAYFSEITNSFRTTVIDYPEVWRNGCMGEELSDGDQTRFAQMYYLYLSSSYWLWLASDIGILQSKSNVITNAFAANIHRYPGIAKMNASKRLWSMEGSKLDLLSLQQFSAAIQTRLAELQMIEWKLLMIMLALPRESC
jgi:hypothetical protein